MAARCGLFASLHFIPDRNEFIWTSGAQNGTLASLFHRPLFDRSRINFCKLAIPFFLNYESRFPDRTKEDSSFDEP